jgi:hypothetical protein
MVGRIVVTGLLLVTSIARADDKLTWRVTVDVDATLHSVVTTSDTQRTKDQTWRANITMLVDGDPIGPSFGVDTVDGCKPMTATAATSSPSTTWARTTSGPRAGTSRPPRPARPQSIPFDADADDLFEDSAP